MTCSTGAATTLSLVFLLGCATGASAHEPAATPPAASQDLDPSTRLAASVVDRFHEALVRGDSSFAILEIAEDAIIFEQGHAERSKAEYAAAHLPADAAYAKATKSERVRRTAKARGDTAIVLTEGRTRGTFNGKPVDRLTTETMVLRQVLGRWLIVHIHWSSAAPPAS